MNNTTLIRQNRLLCLFATLTCALSAFALEKKPTVAPPNCEQITPVSATATSGDAFKAIDNLSGTRWESEATDPQTLTVDLGSEQNVNTVTIDWETANAKDYTLSGSVNGIDWVIIGSFTNMPLGMRTDIIDNINASYRYLKMDGTARNTIYGYSIWQFYVCATAIVPIDCTPVLLTTATASTGNAALAVDNDMGTRWESPAADPQTLTVDMGAVGYMNTIDISWETASAKDYVLSASVNGTDWVEIGNYTNMPNGPRVDEIVINDTYRYFRMHGTARNTIWGYSIYEFDICGDPIIAYAPVPALVQAESWYEMSGVQTQGTADTGGGLHVGFIDPGDWMDYPIDVPVAGLYTIDARVASAAANGGGTIEYLADGTSLGTVNVPNTGDWQTFQTVSKTVNLPAGQYMLRVKDATGQYNLNWIEIKGTVTTWNGTAWSNGAPTATANAIMNGAYNGDSFDVAGLLVNTGNTLTVTEGKTITITGQLTNNGQIIVANNGALVQQTGSAYSGTGTATVYRHSNALKRLDYTMWGSPVSGSQSLLNFSPLTFAANPSRFYTYGILPNGAEGYISVASPSTTPFAAGTGYLIRTPNALTEDAAAAQIAAGLPAITVADYNTGAATNSRYVHQGTFTGVPNNGNISVALQDVNGASLAEHYIAVSNPYPSPINIQAFLTENQDVISGTLYLWRKRNVLGGSASSYVQINNMGYTRNMNAQNEEVEGGDIDGTLEAMYQEGEEDSWILSPGQGFIVGAENAGTIDFTNAMRVAAPTSGGQPFFKTNGTNDTNDTPAVSKWWLNLTGASNTFSQTLVGYLPQATLGKDYGYDGNMLSDAATRLYSKEAGESFGIQARPSFTAADVVPMGFSVGAAGQYNLSLERVTGVFAQGQNIYIKDNLLGTTSQLGEEGYTFTSDAGTFEGRFEVVYQTDGELGNNQPGLENAVMVYQSEGVINITAGNIDINGVTIYDIRGRRLYAQTGINATQASINNLNVAQQVLIVEIDTVNGKVTKRIVY